jgi:fluoride exporter
MVLNLLCSLSIGLNRLMSVFTAIDPSLRTPLAICLGAIPGALSRYYLTQLCTQWFGTSFPYGTFIINLSGALLMGFFVTLTLAQAIPSPDLRLLVAVGFLGSYTTFSTYALDTSTLIRAGHSGAGLFYWLGSAILGAVSLELGSLLARRMI